MGVPGLWDILRPAGEQRALTHLAITSGFLPNPHGLRGLRIGIDASIWFYHATHGREGENPELRTLFFRCARLLRTPFLPLFVFDGPHRPKLKRKKKVSGSDHWMVTGMCEIIEAFGFEWRVAPGEAEAELAYLNRVGVLDAVVTDDVDTFVFGAAVVIRNPGRMLTGNAAHPVRNTAGRDDGEHAYVYRSATFPSLPSIGLTHGGLVLIALLRGGDYAPEGLPGCGPGTAHALAKAGFGDTLLQAAKTLSKEKEKEKLDAFLDAWRDEVRAELKSNSRGLLGSKKAALAKSFPDTFPDPVVLSLYANPLTSESNSKPNTTTRPCALSHYKWEREPDLGKLAALCERKFEWGVRPLIVKRFRTVIWEPMVLRILRRACLDLDRKECGAATTTTTMTTPERRGRRVRGSESEGDDGVRLPPPSGTPSKMIARHFSSLTLDSPSRQRQRRRDLDSNNSDSDASDAEAERLILKIHSKREHASTDGIPEYRLEVAPAQLVRLTEAGILGTRPIPAGSSQSQSALFYTGDDDDDDGNDDAFDEDDEDDDDDAGGKSKGAKAKRRKPPPDPASHMRMWMPACMVERVEPAMVREFEEKEARKREKKSGKGVKAKAATSADASGKGVGIAGAKPTSKAKAKAKAAMKTKTKGKKPAASATEEEEEEEETLSAPEDFSDVFGLVAGPGPGPKGKAKGKSSDAASRGRGRAKAKALPVTCEEEEDDDDDDVTPVKLKPGPQKVTKSKSKPVFVNPDPDPDPESNHECPPPPPPPPTSSQRSALLDALDSSHSRSANPGPGPSSSHASSSARSSASTSTSTSSQPTQTHTRELRPFPIFFDSSDVNPAWPSSSSSLISTEGRGGPEKRSTRMRTPSTSSASASSSSGTTCTSQKKVNDNDNDNDALQNQNRRSPRKSPRTSRLQESPKSRGRSRIPSMTLPRPTMSTSTSAKQNLPPNFDDADDAAKKGPAEKLAKARAGAGARVGMKPLLAARARARTQTQARNDVGHGHGAPTQRQSQKSREIISLILDDEEDEDEGEGEGYLDSWRTNRDGRAGSPTPTPTRPRPCAQRRQEVQLIVISSSEEDDDEASPPPPPRPPPRGAPQTQSKPEPALPHPHPSTTQLPKPKPKPKPRPVAPVETNTSGNANANARIDSLFRVSKPRAKAINIASAVGGKPIVKPDGTQNAKAQARERARARVPLASVNMSEVIDLD